MYKSGGIGIPWGPCAIVNLLGSVGTGLALVVLGLSAKLLFTRGIRQPHLCYNSVFDGSPSNMPFIPCTTSHARSLTVPRTDPGGFQCAYTLTRTHTGLCGYLFKNIIQVQGCSC